MADTRAMVAGVALSTVSVATYLPMPQFIDAVVVVRYQHETAPSHPCNANDTERW
jgi:hypothetical protein